MGEFKTLRVPIFLEAKTKEELVVKMIATNTVNNAMFNYFPPIKEGKNWVVWFFADTDNFKKAE